MGFRRYDALEKSKRVVAGLTTGFSFRERQNRSRAWRAGSITRWRTPEAVPRTRGG